MRRRIDQLSDEDRRVFWMWVRGVAAAYAILIMSLIVYVSGGHLLGVRAVHEFSAAASVSPEASSKAQTGDDRMDARQRAIASEFSSFYGANR